MSSSDAHFEFERFLRTSERSLRSSASVRASASRLESILERRCFRERFAAPKFTFEREFWVPLAVASVLFCRFSSLESVTHRVGIPLRFGVLALLLCRVRRCGSMCGREMRLFGGGEESRLT